MTEENKNGSETSIEIKYSLSELIEHHIDWMHVPVPEALSTLGELKRAYERTAAKVLARAEKSPPKLFCWAWEHRKDGYAGKPIPEKIVTQCLKIISNGKWKYRDESHKVMRDGVEILEPVHCCSVLCTDMFLRWRNDQKAKRLGASTSVQQGIEVRTP